MKRFLAPLLLAGWLCLAAFPGSAAIVFPALTGRVVDNAHLLRPAAVQGLTDTLARHEAATGEQLVIVTLPDLQGMPIEDYGYQLGRHWGIGQKGKDSGALLIIAAKDRAVRIEAGYGVEGRLTDAASAQIINQIIVPAFRASRFEDGIVAGTQAILATLGGPDGATTVPQQGAGADHPSHFPWIIILLVLYLLFFRRSRSGVAPFILGTMLGRSGGSGFGGFGGGGGSFGGGGASGRW